MGLAMGAMRMGLAMGVGSALYRPCVANSGPRVHAPFLPVDDGVHSHLDGVRVGQQEHDLERVLDDAHLQINTNSLLLRHGANMLRARESPAKIAMRCGCPTHRQELLSVVAPVHHEGGRKPAWAEQLQLQKPAQPAPCAPSPHLSTIGHWALRKRFFW